MREKKMGSYKTKRGNKIMQHEKKIHDVATSSARLSNADKLSAERGIEVQEYSSVDLEIYHRLERIAIGLGLVSVYDLEELLFEISPKEVEEIVNYSAIE